MPIIHNFSIVHREPGKFPISLSPAVSIGGRTIEYVLLNHYGGQPRLTKSAASGFSAVSGITITNSSEGKFQVDIIGADTSGWPFGVYPHEARIISGGGRITLTQGYMTLLPGGE